MIVALILISIALSMVFIALTVISSVLNGIKVELFHIRVLFETAFLEEGRNNLHKMSKN